MSSTRWKCWVVAGAAFAALEGDVARAQKVQIRQVPPVVVPSREVFEGLTATFALQFFNGSAAAIFTPRPLRVANGIDFVAGDRNDEVYDTRIVNDKCAVVGRLMPGGTCDFDFQALTRDADPKPPANHGDWLVRVAGVYQVPDPDGGLVAEFAVLDKLQVRVRDPLPTPEPSSVLLLGVGLPLCGVLRLRRRRRMRRP